MGSDQTRSFQKRGSKFQSTLPVWGATPLMFRCLYPHYNFNPRSPCGERPANGEDWAPPALNFNPRSPCGERLHSIDNISISSGISIHAPRVGSDLTTNTRTSAHQSISIHAPRVGSDLNQPLQYRGLLYHFNPRSPCGERQPEPDAESLLVLFQSTLPVWGATMTRRSRPFSIGFQSTLPVWGATPIKQERP